MTEAAPLLAPAGPRAGRREAPVDGLLMVATPFVAPYIGLNNPRSAVIFGGLIGTSSGVAGGLAATDPKLVPYGCLTAAFYTALGCLFGPSLLFFVMRGLLG